MNDFKNRNRFFILITSLTCLALFAPYILLIQGSNRILLAAVTWSLIVIESMNESSIDCMLIVPPLSAFPIVFVLVLPRILFVYTIRGYFTKRNQEGNFFLGFMLILAQLLIPCVYYYFNPFYIEFPRENGPIIIRPGPSVGDLICIPIPILLCIGLLLLGYWKPE